MDGFASLRGAANRSELIAAGYADHEIRSAVRAAVLTQLGSGVVIVSDQLDGTPEQQHRELAIAWARRNPTASRALGTAAAAAVLGLPVWGLDTSRVVFVEAGTKSRSRTTSAMRVVADRRPPAITVVDGVPVMDFYWREQRVVGESDGRSKYAGESGRDRALYEKGRSDAIVEPGNRVIHWDWDDVNQRTRLIARLTTMLSTPGAAGARTSPVSTDLQRN